MSVGASDADGAANVLTYSLGPGAPSGMTIDAGSGELIWATGESQGGTTNRVTVTVRDNGVPALSDSRSFNVVVREVNSAPQVGVIGLQRIDFGQTLTLAIGASDADVPANVLTYSLEPGAPLGAAINPSTGVLRWTPSLAQANSTNAMVVKVTDNGVPGLSAAVRVTVIVNSLNAAPVLEEIPDQLASVGRFLIIPCRASDADIPAQTLRFSLEAGAPAGAKIDPTRGELIWRPSAAYAKTTNVITVRVTDDGQPPMSDTKSLKVAVSDYVEVSIGSTVVRAGESGSVPLQLISSDELEDVVFALEYPTNRLVNVRLEGLAPQIGSVSVQGTSTGSVIAINTALGQVLQGTNVLGRLAFVAVSDQSSAFVPLRVGPMEAGTATYELTNTVGKAGRVVVVGGEPLLEAELLGDGSRRLILYGKVGANYQIQRSADLSQRRNWLKWQNVTLSNLWQSFEGVEERPGGVFYRALEPGEPPYLEVRPGAGQGLELLLYGRPGVAYRLETGTVFTDWTVLSTVTLTNSFGVIGQVQPTNRFQFFRVNKP